MNDLIKAKLQLLPESSGCYLMKDKNNKVIYVGKAKVLKNRVKSYFTGAHNAKTTLLVSEICDFDYIMTSSNKECFILEINLIKQYDPKYNIMLTDDKTYPYILLTNEVHPRLLVTRTLDKRKIKNGHLFGPYPNVYSARKTCELLNRIYPLRKCKNIPDKECLYYHMHQCLAPCVTKEDIDYQEYKRSITKFLNGNSDDIINTLKEKMEIEASKLNFEVAKEYRDLINDINNTCEKQKISIQDLEAIDVFGFYHDDTTLSVCVLYIRNGVIVQNYYSNFPIVGNVVDVVSEFMMQFYKEQALMPKQILMNEDYMDEELPGLLSNLIIIPRKGDKREILIMAEKNAKEALETKKTIYENKVVRSMNTIEELGRILGIDTPYVIEAFDNSNLYGEFPVSGMVVFKNGRPSKKDYRKYHVKTVVGANDYETMKEIVGRRYKRLVDEKAPLPNLIIMDGGKIQVNACEMVLKDLNIDINVMGIQKNDKHLASQIVFKDKEIDVDKNSDLYLLLASISQTVHDYAISFFRSTKAKGMFSSRLDGIKGLGPKGKEKIIKHFMTIDNIKNAKLEEIIDVGINHEIALEIIKKLNEN